MKIILSADKHTRSQAPYKQAILKFFEWYAVQPFNTEDSLFIDLGDLFHYAKPTPDDYHLATAFLDSVKSKRKWLMAGNHDFDKDEKGNVIFSLKPYYHRSDCEIFTDVTEKEIDNVKMIFLPWAYSFDGKTMSEYYSNELKKTHDGKQFDFIFYHFADDTVAFGKEKGYDISYLRGKRMGGDIHLASSNYLGVPIPTRKDERGQKGKIAIIDTVTKAVEYVDVPVFLDFYITPYGETAPRNKEGFEVTYITEAPSIGDAYSTYKDYHIGGVTLKQQMVNASSQKSSGSVLSIKEYLDQFISEKKVSDGVSTILKRTLSES
jgi:hypothetical protein